MNSDCPKFRSVVEELDRVSPGVPLLALGQTVFWDEPMKSGIFAAFQECGEPRSCIAGVHDTDYFAKFKGSGKGFAALPHNDTSTKDLWSAAGEFSHLFGSETVVTKEKLSSAGAKTSMLEEHRPGFLDEITEAYGWRGVVSLSDESKITAEKELSRMLPQIFDTFTWAVDESLRLISGRHHSESEKMRDHLVQLICETAESSADPSLAAYYEALIPEFYQLVAGRKLDIETTRTTRLLKFNRETCGLDRFKIVDLFLNPKTKPIARAAYDDAVAGSEIYTLDRFGSGTLPFDLYIPGVGRGTLRLGNRGGVVMTDDPIGFSFKKPIESIQQLAEVIEAKFGPDCVLVGKAVSLILMLSAEYVFVFHEGASGYVWRSAQMAESLIKSGVQAKWHPILRTKLNPWDAMDDCCAWLHLPETMHRAFGTDELSAPTFALRWKEVARAQKSRLSELSEVRRPLALLGYLQRELGGQWECLAQEYGSIQQEFAQLGEQIKSVKDQKRAVLAEFKSANQQRNDLQDEKGRHWREAIFEKSPSEKDWAKREQIISQIKQLDQDRYELKDKYGELESHQNQIVTSYTVTRIRERRFNIALEAELMRAKLIREAVVSSAGLEKAGYRPAAWWFPLVCPDGTWFRSTMMKTECRLEPLLKP